MPLPQSKRNIRIQQIARYRITGRLQDKQIAALFNITPQGLQQIIQTPEYIELEESLLSGQVSKMDEALAGNIEEMKNHFKVAVPVAARTLLDIVQQRRDLRASLAAAKEILDRDPDHTFTPVRQIAPTGPGQQNGVFNPANAGAVITSMTVEAARVTAQLQSTQPAPTSPAPPTPPITIQGETGGAA